MKTMKERKDGISLRGAVEWRCHQCAVLVEDQIYLTWRDQRLLCEECLLKPEQLAVRELTEE